MESLARGLAVMRCFADAQKPLTIAQASRLTGISRPAVRRCLHTLVVLGYARQEETRYSLLPQVLSLGHAYLSSSPLTTRAQPVLDRLRDELHESCSVGILEGDEVCYVARAEVSRIMSIALRVGSRLPLHCTSMGRILLAARPAQAQDEYLARADLRLRTSSTEIEPCALRAILRNVSEDGFAIVDQELEEGLRSIAVPILSGKRVVAALNLGTQSSRVPIFELRTRFLPVLRRAAVDLGRMMSH